MRQAHSWAMALLCCASGSISALAADNIMPAPQVFEAMKAADAQLTDLRLRYTRDSPHHEKGSVLRKLIEGAYAQKLPEGWIYQSSVRQLSDPVTNQSQKHNLPNQIATFDGTVTTVLQTDANDKGVRVAEIHPGRVEKFFPKDENPHMHVYRASAAMTFEEYLSPDSLTMAPDTELVGDIPCLSIAGRAAGGNSVRVWVAPSRSFLPIKMTIELPGYGAYQQELSELIQLENGMWYPKRITRGLPNKSDALTTFVIHEASTKVLQHSEFEVLFPPGTRVGDVVNNRTYTTVSASTRPTAPLFDPVEAEKSLQDYIRKANEQAKQNRE